MRLPKIVEDLTSSFEKLPGIGRRSAQRLAFYLLRVPQRDLDSFAAFLANLKKQTKLCSICHNLSDQEQCAVCADSSRNSRQVCVVESFQDVLAIEKSGSYSGVYHVLHGCISPLNNIGPDELFIDTLVTRVKKGGIDEVILATNTSLEGEATALYVKQALDGLKVEISRIGRGLPTGVEIEYADETTLAHAFGTRRSL
ncbi:MAG: Recombination protein RecR [Microgenomates group bacterium GW2011_GWB1_46_7]|uniref:Recombination protein RecR n=1 Tax=Candidatus Collierbacteria bacterium RIFOXYA2_FULL_46_10 TaxID=1817726 RepID=A0A1F5F6M5_9BACT|nr:MAG: Recombination protein RecR [Microgenomates group bacterium GW2011_GWA1_46_7]KKU44683.1 MAG: Recombination protein RecR [Microgenomates group bacterium GW2011_GWB1_46_7]OGD75236.1 MAG: recombination protein RecR [Candidatus Collierbacteria bacterium RIFOXYA2_FULL_46_10]